MSEIDLEMYLLAWLSVIQKIKRKCTGSRHPIKIVRLNILEKALSGDSGTMSNITVFDPKDHHIRLVVSIKTPEGSVYEFRAILDTGAPSTEFSDQFLAIVGMHKKPDSISTIQSDQESQKYARLILPKVTICGHDLYDMPVFVSHYRDCWSMDALIGLDFFRRYEVKINYKSGTIVTEGL
jgi:hypothetical protein